MKHRVIKEIPKANCTEVNKKFHHGKIKKGKILKSKIDKNGDDMVITKLGRNVCRVNSAVHQRYFEVIEEK